MAEKLGTKKNTRDLGMVDFVDALTLIIYAVYLVLLFVRVTQFYRYKNPMMEQLIDLIPKYFLLAAVYKMYCYAGRVKEYVLPAGVILLVLCFFGYHNSRNILWVVALAVAVYNIDFERITRLFTIVISMCLSVTVISAMIGLIPNLTYNEAGDRGRMFFLGFDNHNAAMSYMFGLCIVVIYWQRKAKIKNIGTLIIVAVTAFFYYLTRSRTPVYVLVLGAGFIIAFLILSAKPLEKIASYGLKALRVFLASLPLLSVFISLAGVLWYNKHSSELAYSTFMNRFAYMSITFAENGIRLPWQPTAYAVNSMKTYSWLFGGARTNLPLDNLYGSLLLNNGIVVMLLIALGLQAMAIRAYRLKDDHMLVILGMIALYGIMDSAGIYVHRNVFTLLPFTACGFVVEDEVPPGIGLTYVQKVQEGTARIAYRNAVVPEEKIEHPLIDKFLEKSGRAKVRQDMIPGLITTFVLGTGWLTKYTFYKDPLTNSEETLVNANSLLANISIAKVIVLIVLVGIMIFMAVKNLYVGLNIRWIALAQGLIFFATTGLYGNHLKIVRISTTLIVLAVSICINAVTKYIYAKVFTEATSRFIFGLVSTGILLCAGYLLNIKFAFPVAGPGLKYSVLLGCILAVVVIVALYETGNEEVDITL